MFGNRSGVVATTEKAKREYGNKRTVRKIFDLQQYVVEYFDNRGELHTAVVVRVGDKYFLPENGEQWCESLKPCADWLQGVVHARVSKEPEAPNKDSVSVLKKRTTKKETAE